jgi:hypothetical protein
MADNIANQSAIGSLLHLMHCLRPDIAVAVGALAACCSELSTVHHAVMLDVVHYAGTTASRGITLEQRTMWLAGWCHPNF